MLRLQSSSLEAHRSFHMDHTLDFQSWDETTAVR